jgi:hypothetical protein
MAAAQPLVHPRYLRSEELGQEITQLCSYIFAATYRLLVMIREFDQDKLWADDGICSCAHWLNYRCGIGLNAAREKIRVAHALQGLPKISAAFEKGELSYSKVRAMTRIATPATEETLLMWAKHSTAHHMESLASKYRKVRRCQETQTAQDQYRDRNLNWYFDEDGSLVIKGRLPAEQGALLIQALQLGLDSAEEDAKSEDVTAEISDDQTERSREPIEVRRADALMQMAESFLASGRKSSSSANRYQVMLHVSAETLTRDVTAETPADQNIEHDGELALSHIEHGPHVTAETSKRLCCDSNIILNLSNKMGETLNIGRKSRTIPPAMRRALRMRDQGCRFPGCTHRHFIDGHHIKHWSKGGETSLDNLVLLCRHHHRLVHEGGFACEKSEEGQLVFRNETGKVIGGWGTVLNIQPNPLVQKRIQNRLEELYIQAGTCVTQWEGARVDYELATELLWNREFPDN